jgi:transcription termination factor Rho
LDATFDSLNLMTTLTGILDWPARAEGRVRQVAGGLPVVRDDDPFVPLSFGERYGLRPGLTVTVEVGVRGNHRGQPHGQRPSGHHQQQQRGHHRQGGGGGGGGGGRSVVESIVAIEGMDPDRFSKTKPFDELTSIDPQPRLTLEYPGCPASCRLIDLFCPIGRGQRGLIVSPPKAGKTTLLKDIAGSILRNHDDVELIILLIDERPEEMTDFRRSFANVGSTEDLIESGAEPILPAAPTAPREGQSPGQPPMHPRCRVIGSSNDHDVEQHIAIAMLTLDRCRRMVEAGRHVVVLLDSLTRLGRAFNRSRKHASSGRTMTGGIDSRALEVPKQIFGAARNTEEAGSLTILATCLVDTGSAGDQLIFEEFKGTGNMELVLDRKISERRLFPAINLAASGTRKEHLLMDEQELKTVTALRRRLINMPPHLQVEQLLAALNRFSTNAALVGSAG